MSEHDSLFPNACLEVEALSELAETLASALHHNNIGRNIAGWRDVSEAFSTVKALLERRYFGPGDE